VNISLPTLIKHIWSCLFLGDHVKQTAKTKQGQKLRYILGLTEDVLQFDKARKELRASPQNTELINKYLNVLPVMETKLLHEQTNIKQQLKNIERQHVHKNGTLLTTKTLLKDPTSKLLMDKLKLWCCVTHQIM
jgi:hypothetical protein